MEAKNQSRQTGNDLRGVVGIGASAGGLEALQQLLGKLPTKTDLAYVIIQHLSPDYRSMLGEILSKHTQMPVLQAKDGTPVKMNQIYLIPPRFNMEISDGCLHLSEYNHGIINHPIDVFLRSLAKAYENRSVAVILSGTGSDGTNGIKAIKEENGVIIVQSPESAKFDGMPRSALSTGFADLVLPPEEIALEMSHIASSFSSPTGAINTSDETMLSRIFAILKSVSNINYTYYKKTTILRRIERRMVVNHKLTLPEYVDLLTSKPEEAKTLSREVLIGVTRFFRDPDYFDYLKQNVVKPLVTRSQNGSEDQIRVWVAGCSSGEEAYSVGILFMEVMEELNLRRSLKIFATDLDQDSIAFAGRGSYGENIVEDVSINRLSKYFTKKNGKYVVNHDLRKLIIFSPHNVFQDPPFGRLDLICCRNLLIYFQPVLQKDLFGIFNLALRDGGYLFLGRSEAINANYSDVFLTVGAAEKIYVHHANGKTPERTNLSYMLPSLDNSLALTDPVRSEPEPDYATSELYLKTLDMFMPTCILVNDKNEIKHVFGETQDFLSMPAGNFTADVFTLLNKDLRIVTSTALKASRDSQTRVAYKDVVLNTRQGPRQFTLIALPLPDKFGEPSELTALAFVTQSDQKLEAGAISYKIDKVASQRITDLEQELHHTQDDLKRTITELESVNEELQAANEELLTANEELQSSNEELQSVNEELYTVNSEYQQKVSELAILNDDINNFLSTTLIGIMFVDSKLRIRKFTNYITGEFNVLPQDVGRPLQYIAYNFMNGDLIKLSQNVLTTLKPVERDLVSVNGKPYFVRIAPYRADGNKVPGLILTFVDTTKQRSDKKQLEEMEQALERSRKANLEKNSFLSRMSHDMRTPLNAILGLTYLMLDNSTLNESNRRNILKIRSSGQYLLGIISDVLDTSMIENGKLKQHLAPVFEEEIIHEVEAMMLLSAEEHHLFFEHSIKGCQNECLIMDKGHVTQILVNLLSNAMKFTEENGKVEFVTTVDRPDKKHVRHTYVVKDNGRGMSQEFQQRMYLPFEQEQSSQDGNISGGTGLGLFIVKNLVDMMGGTITCASRISEGTTFTVTITYDLATDDQKSAVLKARSNNTYEETLRNKKVLLCDDHELNGQIAKFMLESKEMQVDYVKNGQEAVNKFNGSAPGEYAAILMDIRMPIMDGIQATMKIRTLDRPDAARIPIIALTANALDEEEHVCLEAGMNARLTKPINPDSLYMMLSKFLATKPEEENITV